jgi:hypothetical protein
MSLQLAATQPADLAGVVEFLKNTFPSSAQMNSFDEDVFAWKYLSPHPGWSGSRSYMVKGDRGIVAHAGLWPLCLTNSGKPLGAIHLIDWAAGRTEPGSGVMLLKKLASTGNLLLTIGGSVATQAILPKLGYRRAGEMKLFALVTRPLKQARENLPAHWKTLPRLLRNALWSLTARLRLPDGWSVASVTQFDDLVQGMARNSSDCLTSRRTAALLNHFLACPGARFSAFAALYESEIRGYFVLSQVGGQTRIVDLGWAGHDRKAVCAVAAHTARSLPETCEVVFGASSPEAQAEFAGMGFRVRQVLPIFYYDAAGLLSGEPRFDLTMLDGDMCLLSNRKRPYLT